MCPNDGLCSLAFSIPKLPEHLPFCVKVGHCYRSVRASNCCACCRSGVCLTLVMYWLLDNLGVAIRYPTAGCALGALSPGEFW